METDQPNINAILNGDAKAFATLVDQHKNLVFTVALRMLKNREEAEEVAQDTFIKVFTSLKKFKGECKLSTWIYRIAYNSCLDRLKKVKKMQKTVQVEEVNNVELREMNTVFTEIARKEKAMFLQECMKKLAPKDAAILTLFYFEEKRLGEMAVLLNRSENTVKVQLHRARTRLANIVKDRQQHVLKNDYGQ